MVTWCPSANTGASVHAAATRAVPVVSVTAPGATHPAARAAAVWSMAPVATGIPGAGSGLRRAGQQGAYRLAAVQQLRQHPHWDARRRQGLLPQVVPARWNQPVEVCRDFSPASRPVSQCRR